MNTPIEIISRMTVMPEYSPGYATSQMQESAAEKMGGFLEQMGGKMRLASPNQGAEALPPLLPYSALILPTTPPAARG